MLIILTQIATHKLCLKRPLEHEKRDTSIHTHYPFIFTLVFLSKKFFDTPLRSPSVSCNRSNYYFNKLKIIDVYSEEWVGTIYVRAFILKYILNLLTKIMYRHNHSMHYRLSLPLSCAYKIVTH